MNSSFSTLRALNRQMSVDLSAILDRLHTVSIEYTVIREKGQETLLRVEILCLLEEKTKQIP